MADCPNCGTEVRPEWSLCPHCKVNMRTYAGPRGGYVHPVTPSAPAPVAAPAIAQKPAQAPADPVVQVPAPTPVVAAGPEACPSCGTALPREGAEYCPECGDPVASSSAAARIRRLLSNRVLVGAIGVVFLLLIAGLVLAPPAEEAAPGVSAQAAGVAPVKTPTVTIAVRTTTSQAPARVPSGNVSGNLSGNVTPVPLETVLVVKTLDRYIQNAGGDQGSQLRTPAPAPTPTVPTPVPTSASGQTGSLSWNGEGTYVTEPFALYPGTVQVEMTAGALTMVQLRDISGRAIGIATAGPQAATTPISVPAAGTYRLEVWPFGAGTWSVRISYPLPTTVPTLAPVVIVTTANVTTVPTTALETTIPPTTANTMEITTVPTTTVPTTVLPTPTPIPQIRQKFEGGNGTFSPKLDLNAGLAVFSFSTEGSGRFAVTLVDPAGKGIELIAFFTGPGEGSKSINIPASGTYHLNIEAPGSWKVSIE